MELRVGDRIYYKNKGLGIISDIDEGSRTFEINWINLDNRTSVLSSCYFSVQNIIKVPDNVVPMPERFK